MNRKRNPIYPKQTMLIVTSNGAMSAYFSRMRKDCRYVNLSVEFVPASSLEELIKFTGKQRIAGKFSSAWALFAFADFGLTASDVKNAQDFALQKKVNLCWSNPNLGLWVLMHLRSLNVLVNDPQQFNQALSKVFPGYEDSAAYMSNEGQDLHLNLFSAFSKAVVNVAAYNRLSERSTGLEATNIPIMYEDIKKCCGEADISHNQKLLSK